MTGKGAGFERGLMIFLLSIGFAVDNATSKTGRRKKGERNPQRILDRRMLKNCASFPYLFKKYTVIGIDFFYKGNIKTLCCHKILHCPEGRRVIYAGDLT